MLAKLFETSSSGKRSWLRSTTYAVLLASLTTVLLLADDFLQQLYTPNNLAELEISYVFVLWVISLCLWLSGRRWFVNIVLAMLAFMQLLQLSHISYIGAPLTPFDISKLFSEREEIGLVIESSFADHWPVLLAWGIPYSLLFLIYNFGIPRFRLSRSWIAIVMVVLIIGSKPNRATYRDMIAFMPGPTRSSLHNSINAFSYYAVRMMGQTSSVTPPDFEPYEVSRVEVEDAPEHIFLVIPDSVRHGRLGIAGYERQTTPLLGELKKQGELQVVQGIAASVATGSSLPLLMNVVSEPGNIATLEQSPANLFRRAKEAGYKTFWISSQESKMMNGLGSRYIDVRITEEDKQIELGRKGDKAVLDWLEEQDWGERNFVVINLRTAHTPYSDAYEEEPDRYEIWPTGDSVPYARGHSNAYDNALVYLDTILAGTIRYLEEQLEGDRLWIFTSDHGQMLGENNQWGHNRLTKSVAAVPMVLYQARDEETDDPYRLPDTDFISHYELGNWLLGKMGYELSNPNKTYNVHYFHSDKLFEDNLFVKILEKDGRLLFCEPTLVSRYELEAPCDLADGSVRIATDSTRKPGLGDGQEPSQQDTERGG